MPLLRGSIILKSCTVLLHAGLLARVSLAELQDVHFYLLCFLVSISLWVAGRVWIGGERIWGSGEALGRKAFSKEELRAQRGRREWVEKPSIH